MRVIHALREFVAFESAGDILLVTAAVAAPTIANSPLAFLYDAFLDNHHTYLRPRIGKVNARGQFDIIEQATSWVRPDPYLVDHTPQDRWR
jgi:Na+/H+ antiporter NhaA